MWAGKAYRVDVPNVGIPRNATAADVVRFERDELGNDNHVRRDVLALLEHYPASALIWVGKDRESVEPYLTEDMTVDDISVFDLPPGSVIVGTDDQGGYLVLKGAFRKRSSLRRKVNRRRVAGDTGLRFISL